MRFSSERRLQREALVVAAMVLIVVAASYALQWLGLM